MICVRRFCGIILWSDRMSCVDASAQRNSWTHFAELALRMFHVLIRAFAAFVCSLLVLLYFGMLERVYAEQLNSQRFSTSRALAFSIAHRRCVMHTRLASAESVLFLWTPSCEFNFLVVGPFSVNVADDHV